MPSSSRPNKGTDVNPTPLTISVGSTLVPTMRTRTWLPVLMGWLVEVFMYAFWYDSNSYSGGINCKQADAYMRSAHACMLT